MQLPEIPDLMSIIAKRPLQGQVFLF